MNNLALPESKGWRFYFEIENRKTFHRINLDLQTERVQLIDKLQDYIHLRKEPIINRNISLIEIDRIIDEINQRLEKLNQLLLRFD